MCSIPGVAGDPGQVDRLGQAIDELAEAAQAAQAQGAGLRDAGMQDGTQEGTRDGMQEVAAHLARVWGMVADLDPELARRLAGYDA